MYILYVYNVYPEVLGLWRQAQTPQGGRSRALHTQDPLTNAVSLAYTAYTRASHHFNDTPSSLPTESCCRINGSGLDHYGLNEVRLSAARFLSVTMASPTTMGRVVMLVMPSCTV